MAPGSPALPQAQYESPDPQVYVPTQTYVPSLWTQRSVSWDGENHVPSGLFRWITWSRDNSRAPWLAAVRSAADEELRGIANVATQVRYALLLCASVLLRLAFLGQKRRPNPQLVGVVRNYSQKYQTPEEEAEEKDILAGCPFVTAGDPEIDHAVATYVLTTPAGVNVREVTIEQAQAMALEYAHRYVQHELQSGLIVQPWWSGGPYQAGIHLCHGAAERDAWSPDLPRALRLRAVEVSRDCGLPTSDDIPGIETWLRGQLRGLHGREVTVERLAKKKVLQVWIPVALRHEDSHALLAWIASVYPPVWLDLAILTVSARGRGKMERTKHGLGKSYSWPWNRWARKVPVDSASPSASPLTLNFLGRYLAQAGERARPTHGRVRDGAAIASRLEGGPVAVGLQASPATSVVLDAVTVWDAMRLVGLPRIEARGRCPIHEGGESQDTFQVYAAGRMWCCWSSRCAELSGKKPASGNAIHLVAAVRKSTYPEARAWLAEQVGIDLGALQPAEGKEAAAAEPDPGAEVATEVAAALRTLALEQRGRANELILAALQNGEQEDRQRLEQQQADFDLVLNKFRVALHHRERTQTALRKAERKGAIRPITTASAALAVAEREFERLELERVRLLALLRRAERTARKLVDFAVCRAFRTGNLYACGANDEQGSCRPLSCDHPLCRQCEESRDRTGSVARRVSWPDSITVAGVTIGVAGGVDLPSRKDVAEVREGWARRARVSKLSGEPASPLAVVTPDGLVMFFAGDAKSVVEGIARQLGRELSVELADRDLALMAVERALCLQIERFEELVRDGLARIAAANEETSPGARIEEANRWIRVLRRRREDDGGRRVVLGGRGALSLHRGKSAADSGLGPSSGLAFAAREPAGPCCPRHGSGCDPVGVVCLDMRSPGTLIRLPDDLSGAPAHEVTVRARWEIFRRHVITSSAPKPAGPQPPAVQTVPAPSPPPPARQPKFAELFEDAGTSARDTDH